MIKVPSSSGMIGLAFDSLKEPISRKEELHGMDFKLNALKIFRFMTS